MQCEPQSVNRFSPGDPHNGAQRYNPTPAERLEWRLISPADFHPNKPRLRERAISAFGHRCSYCEEIGTERDGPDGRPWCLDRIIPGAAGGKYSSENVTLSCWACNSRRGATPIEKRIFSLFHWDLLRIETLMEWGYASPAALESIQ